MGAAVGGAASVGFRRFAVYFMPRPESALARFGAAWLGWDSDRCVDCPGPGLDGLGENRAALVAAPRKYGFHGTLTAPFRLAKGTGVLDLDLATRDLAAEFEAFEFSILLSALGAFLALTPTGPVPPLDAVAAACVRRLDHFRAALDPDEAARRHAAGLTARQAALLDAWGYPYVLDEFRFHLTLTGALPPTEQAAASRVLAAALAPMLVDPLPFEDLCLCGEGTDGRFRLLGRHPMRARKFLS